MASDDDGDNEHREFPMGHSSLNDQGGEYLLEEHLAIFGETTTTENVFDKPDKAFQRSRSTYKNTGKWIAETATIEETFKDGPICLDTIAKINATSNQHNFLVDCATFFKKKYPDNWDEPMQWVNVNVLRPPGSPDKLKEIIRTVKDKQYFPRCHEEPMASFCHSKACRLQKYGVGGTDTETGKDLAMTIVNTVPTTYFVGNGGDGDDGSRIRLTADELLNLNKYQVKCLEHARTGFPVNVTAKEWKNQVIGLINDSVMIEPSVLYRRNVKELEALERYFSANIPVWVHTRGEEFLNGKSGDNVRIRVKEEKIYFKWDKLVYWLEKAFGMRQPGLDSMRAYIDTEATYYSRDQKRDWFRCSHSLRFEVFDENVIYHWLHPGEPEET
jgi:hypothetical protein